MSAEDNKAVILRLNEEFWYEGNADFFDEVCVPDYVDHTPAPGQSPDREGFRRFAAALRLALPDIRAPVEDLVAAGQGRVALEHAGHPPWFVDGYPGHRQAGDAGRHQH